MNILQRWWQEWSLELTVFGIGGAVVIGLAWLLIASELHDRRQWAAFSAAHACKVVGQTAPSTAVGFAGGKVVTTVTGGQTGYLCDDGVTYWRNR